MKAKFEPYDDNKFYESLAETNPRLLPNELSFCEKFQSFYQSEKIKLDLSVGIGLKFLDILNK